MIALLSLACITSIKANSHWSKIALSDLITEQQTYDMTYLYFKCFVVSMIGAAKRLEQLSVLMTVTKLIIRLLVTTLTAASD